MADEKEEAPDGNGSLLGDVAYEGHSSRSVNRAQLLSAFSCVWGSR